jgi:ribosomal protein S12 methylthiotransferase
MSIQQDISLEKNRNKVGTVQKVIIDAFESPYYVARTEADSPEVDNTVLIKSAEILNIGDFYNVKIISADSYDLIATLEQDV